MARYERWISFLSLIPLPRPAFPELDVGDAMDGATNSMDAQALTTDSAGRAVRSVAKRATAGHIAMGVSKPGYAKASLAITVTAAAA